MHFHLPKPLHGWREFAGEVGIIVVGVLIALGAEQVVEQVSWHEKVARTKELLNSELHDDELSSYGWLSNQRCLNQQLDAADAAVRNARKTQAIAPVPPYSPELDLFTSDAWLNARSLEVADHFSSEAMRTYSRLYFFPTELQVDIVQLHQLASELQPLAGGLQHVSSDEAGEYQRTIGKARELQSRTALAEKILLQLGARAGIRLSRREMEDAVHARRSVHAACVSEPDLTIKPGG